MWFGGQEPRATDVRAVIAIVLRLASNVISIDKKVIRPIGPSEIAWAGCSRVLLSHACLVSSSLAPSAFRKLRRSPAGARNSNCPGITGALVTGVDAGLDE